MICLLGTAEGPRPGLLKRALGQPVVRAEQARVLGMRVLRVEMVMYDGAGKRAAARALGKAAEAMRLAGCREVVFSRGFGHGEEILRMGFAEAGAERLREELAAEVAKKVSAGGECAAFFAGRLTRRALESLSEMCRMFRRVLADVGEDSRLAAAEMASRHGVSLLVRPSSRRLELASAAVFFDGTAGEGIELPEACVAFFVRGVPDGVSFRRAVDSLDVALDGAPGGELPPEFPAEALVSAALEAGSVRRENIVLRGAAVADQSRRTA